MVRYGLIVDDEEWRPVVGMEQFYDVSNRGRVRSKHKIGCKAGGAILIPQPNKKGYLRVRLSSNGRSFSTVIQRLVLEAFVGPRPSTVHEANHKDGKKFHNDLSNLEWITPQGNNAHAREMGLWHPHIGEQHGRAKLTETKVREILSRRAESSVSLGKEFGVSSAAIWLIWQRINWKHVV